MKRTCKNLIALAKVTSDVTDAMIIMKLQIMALENNQQLLLKKIKRG